MCRSDGKGNTLGRLGAAHAGAGNVAVAGAVLLEMLTPRISENGNSAAMRKRAGILFPALYSKVQVHGAVL
jgi:hypothetical protein